MLASLLGDPELVAIAGTVRQKLGRALERIG
jgi:hypothetical protein